MLCNKEHIINESTLLKFDITDTIYTIFTIEQKNKQIIHFANLLSEFYFPANETLFSSMNLFDIDKKNNVLNKYFTLKTFSDSGNGEYHHELIPLSNLYLIYDKYGDIIDNINKIIAQHLVLKNEIILKFKIFLPTQVLRNKLKFIEESINRTNLGSKLFDMALLLYINKKINTQETYNIFNDNKDLSDLFDTNMAKVLYYLKDKTERFIELINLITYTNYKEKIKFGYKIIYLPLNTVENPFDINDKIWIEHYVSLKTTDLVLNKISNNFPIYAGWLYIRDVKHEIIINPKIKDMLSKSIEYREISDYINKSKNKLEKIYSDIHDHFKNLIDDYLSDFYDLLNGVKIDLLASETLFLMINEFVGVSLFNVITNNIKLKTMGNPLVELNYDIFAKLIFEILYGLLCLHSILGIIHTDLHLNNIIISKNNTTHCSSKFITYKINNSLYANFPNNDYSCNIIDYGLALIHPNFMNMYNEGTEISEFNSITSDINDNIYKNRYVNRLINKYCSVFTSVDKSEIQCLFKKKQNIIYKKLTALDIYTFSGYLLSNFKIMGSKIGLRQYKLIEKINNMSDNILKFQNLSDEKPNDNFPAEKIIKECFNDYIDTKPKEKIISFDITRKMKQNIYSYDNVNEEYLKYYKNIKKNNMFTVLNIIPKRHIEKYL